MFKKYRYILSASVAAFSLINVNSAFAGPEGGVVVGGAVEIIQSTNKTDIHQNTDKAILDWRSFDIGGDEHTQFHQPSASSIILNRINDTKASQIDGKLTANGHVMLINPNGVVFGQGAQIDAGSLTASTADIDNNDFMAGRMDFSHAGRSNGEIINNGRITISEAGLVNFVAPHVENHGVITAKLGKVQLAAADTFTLDLAGDGMMKIAVSDEDAKKLVLNTGQISAEDGHIVLSATRARNIVDSLVENTGIIEASSMTNVGGKIILTSDQGITHTSGILKANGLLGGGEILIGGDYQGQGDISISKNTYVANKALIEANATEAGDGGKVIVWADQNTQFAGKINAHGGMMGGDGGFVETSGKINLDIAYGASVDASAQHNSGAAGSWLLDPSNVTITSGGANNIPGGGGTFDPLTDNYSIDAASIETALNAGNNVTITTTANGGADAESGDILVTNATIQKNVNNNDVTFTLQAHRNITIQDSTITSSENALNVILNADRDANMDGAIYVSNSTFTTLDGNFVAGGGSGALGGANGILGDGDGTGADDTYAYGNASSIYGVRFNNNASVNTGGGSIFINGNAHSINNAAGVIIDGNTSLTTTSGHINLNGEANESVDNIDGILIQNGHLETDSGDIRITGNNRKTSGVTNEGILIQTNSTIKANTTGNIFLTGSAASSVNTSRGINLAKALINYNQGNVTLSGQGNAGQGLLILNGSSIEATGAGTGEITIDAASTSGTALDHYTHANKAVLGGALANGDINIIADFVSFDSNFEARTAQNIYVTPKTNSRSIGLGGGAGDLNLTDAELSYFNAGEKFVIGNSAAGTGDVIITSWDLSSKTHDVEVYGNDFNIAGVTLGSGDFLAHARDNGVDYGDLVITNNITKAVNGISNLNLRADRNISNTGGADIIASDANSDADGNPTTDADSLNIVLNADRNADQNGAISISDANITTLGGYLVLGGGSGTLWGADGIKGTADDAASTGADRAYAYSNSALTSGINIITNTSINTGIGDVIMNGYAQGVGSENGVYIGGGSNITTSSGNVTMRGISNSDTGNRRGIEFSNGHATTENGNITISGINLRTIGGNVEGMRLGNNSSITSSNVGVISITGQSSGTSGTSQGLNIATGIDINYKDGDVTISGITASTGTSALILQGGADITGSGEGDLILNAQSGDGNHGFAINDNGDGTIIGGNGATGNIILNVDNINLGTNTLIKTAGDIKIAPRSNGVSIGLGSDAGNLSLNDVELGYFDAGNKLSIGSNATSNNLAFINTWDLFGKSYDVDVIANDIQINGLTLGAGNVSLIADNNVTINTAIGNNAQGGDTYISAGNNFINTAGANAIDVGTARYLIYSQAPSNVTKDGLVAGNYYNQAYNSAAPAAIDTALGSRFVYEYQPTLNIVADDITLDTFLTDYDDFTYDVTGVEGGDNLVDVLSGAPGFTKTRLSPSKYSIIPGMGTLSSLIGYNLNFVNGTLSLPAATQQINDSVLQQIQTPSILTQSGGRQTANIFRALNKDRDNSTAFKQTELERQSRLIHISSPASNPIIGLINDHFLSIEKPIIDYYDLCSFNIEYCQ